MKTVKLLIITLFAINTFASQQNDASFILLKNEYTINKDGSYTLTCEQKIKYLTYYAFHRLYGETFIIYNPEIQTLKINRSQTTMADGKIVVAPENTFNEVLPSWAANSGLYNHYKEMVVTHVGLEIGAISDLSYTIETKSATLGQFQVFEPLRFASPVERLEIIFNVPKGMNFAVNERSQRNLATTTENEKFIIYTYRFSDVPANVTYQFSTVSSVPHLVAAAGNKSINELLQNIEPNSNKKAKNITFSDLDKVLEIQKQLMNIRTIPVPVQYQLFPVQSPEITLQRNSGTPLEKTLLFQKLLADKGFDSEILYEVPKRFFDEKIGNILSVIDNYVFLYIDSVPVAFSATKISKTNPIEKRSSTFITKSDSKVNRIENTINQKLVLNSNITVTNDKKTKNIKITNSQIIEMSGEGLPFIHSTDNQPKANEITKEKNAKITSYNRKNAHKLSFQIDAETDLKNENNLVQIQLNPTTIGVDGWNFGTLPDEISNQFFLPANLTEENYYEITLPAKSKIFIDETNQKTSTLFGDMEININIDNNVITVKRKISFRTTRISQNDYSEFVKMMRTWQSEQYRAFYVQLL